MGPKFLIHHANNLQVAVKELLNTLGVKGDFPTNINRLDLAMDLFDVSMKEQDLDFWRKGWVGRSKVSDFQLNSRTGDLETIYVGSRKSAVFLRVYDKVAQAIKEGDIQYWLDIWQGHNGEVTRVEWQIKPKKGNFQKDMQDFEYFSGFTARELLNYLLDWGRLCIPNPLDSNNRRWEDAPFWEKVRELAYSWRDGVDWPLSRYGKEFHGLSEGYVNFVSGTLSGAMARFKLEDPSFIGMIEGLQENGQSMEQIKRVAVKKAALISRL